MISPKRSPGQMPREHFWAIGISVCVVITVGAGFYVLRDVPEAGDAARREKARGAVPVAQVAEPLQLEALVHNVTAGQAAPELSTSDTSSELERQSADVVQAQQRLEALASRIEERLSQLETHLKRSGLVPLTREENQVEVQRLEKIVRNARQRAERAEGEVRRLALALAVPEAVAKLSPDEAISDSRYAAYRPYFEARFAADYARRVVTVAEQAFGSVAVKSY